MAQLYPYPFDDPLLQINHRDSNESTHHPQAVLINFIYALDIYKIDPMLSENSNRGPGDYKINEIKSKNKFLV